MKKILYITNESDLNRFKDKNRLYRYKAIQNNDNFLCVNANKISKAINPDNFEAICLSHEASPGHSRYGGTKEYENLISRFNKRFVILEDLQKISKKMDLLNSIYTDIILTVEGPMGKEIKENMSCDFHLLTHHINTDLLKEYSSKKEYDVLIYGSINDVYPFRSRLFKLLDNNEFNFKIIKANDDCYGERLGKEINKSWLTVATTSKYDYLVAKYFEISAAGSVILGNMEDIGKTIWSEDEYVNVSTDMSDNEILSIVKEALDSKDKLKDIIKKTGKRIRDEYCVEQYAIKLNEIVRGL